MRHIHGGNIYGRGKVLDFSANINPLGMPEAVRAAAQRGVAASEAYPDVNCTELREAIAAAEGRPYGLSADDVICGSGAAELIYLAAEAVQPEETLLMAPGFAEYEAAARRAGSRIRFYPCVEETGFVPEEDFLQWITPETDLVYLCNPNNPTGVELPDDFPEAVVRRCGACGARLVLDECFIGFMTDGEKRSMLRLVKEHPHLLVLRAFTKLYGMPGLRLGYLYCSDHAFLDRMKERVQPWNVSLPAQEAGIAAMQLTGYAEKSSSYVKREREYLLERMRQMGLICFEAKANFIFFKGPEFLGRRCEEAGVLIRDCSNYRGLSGNCWWRIAVRTREENERLLELFRRIMEN